MDRRDVMVDIETLGNTVGCTVFQVSAMAFDIRTGEIFNQFNLFSDISKEEICANGSTLKWWLKTNADLFCKLLYEGSISETELIKEFHLWLTSLTDSKDLYLWGNGIMFDNNIIKDKMTSKGLTYPIRYNKDRDVRTILELASMKSGIDELELKSKFTLSGTIAHDAYDDVKNQISIVHNCYKIIME